MYHRTNISIQTGL